MRPRVAILALPALLLASPLTLAQSPPSTGETKSFGSLAVTEQATIDGAEAPLALHAEFSTSALLATGARHALVTLGNDTQAGVSVTLQTLAASPAPWLVEGDGTGRVKLWWDLANATAPTSPNATPSDRIGVDLTASVGASAPGSYRLESLLMAMDANYVAIEEDRGLPLQLFAWTDVLVTRGSANGVPTPTPPPTPTPTPTPTGPVDDAPPEESNPLPSPGAWASAATLGACALAATRRARGARKRGTRKR